MTEIVRNMRPHALAAAPFIGELIQRPSPVDPLAVAVVLEMRCVPAHAEWFTRRLVEERAFIGSIRLLSNAFAVRRDLMNRHGNRHNMRSIFVDQSKEATDLTWKIQWPIRHMIRHAAVMDGTSMGPMFPEDISLRFDDDNLPLMEEANAGRPARSAVA